MLNLTENTNISMLNLLRTYKIILWHLDIHTHYKKVHPTKSMFHYKILRNMLL